APCARRRRRGRPWRPRAAAPNRGPRVSSACRRLAPRQPRGEAGAVLFFEKRVGAPSALEFQPRLEVAQAAGGAAAIFVADGGSEQFFGVTDLAPQGDLGRH